MNGKAEFPERGLLHEGTEGASDHKRAAWVRVGAQSFTGVTLMRVFVCEGDQMSNGALALEPPPSSVERGSDHPGSREHSFKQTVNSEIPVS